MNDRHFISICKHHGETSFIRTIGDSHKRCIKCRSEAVQRRRDKIKRMAIEYKGGCCQKCEYDKCITALEFHHLNPLEKDFSISVSGNTRSWAIIEAELDKCILVCANCHREIHAEEHSETKDY
jgi:5-methylcytosine-specific restriction endonuclease McrA